MVTANRAAIYARVSTDDQNEGMQPTTLREMVTHRKWELKVGMYNHGVKPKHSGGPRKINISP